MAYVGPLIDDFLAILMNDTSLVSLIVVYNWNVNIYNVESLKVQCLGH